MSNFYIYKYNKKRNVIQKEYIFKEICNFFLAQVNTHTKTSTRKILNKHGGSPYVTKIKLEWGPLVDQNRIQKNYYAEKFHKKL